MDLKEIQELIKFVSRAGVSEVELESKGFRIVIRTGNGKKNGHAETVMVAAPVTTPVAMPVAAPVAAPVVVAPAAPASPAPAAAPAATNAVQQRSPMIGTFYRSPSPDKPPFVGVGDEVKKGQTLCIIEAMKLFNEIECEFDGRIVKVLADDSSPVEYDQPLFLIEPN